MQNRFESYKVASYGAIKTCARLAEITEIGSKIADLGRYLDAQKEILRYGTAADQSHFLS